MIKIWRSLVSWIRRIFHKNMRKTISLYIGERLVDLDTESLVLFNYAMEDLNNPTIVKNSYSQQITLQGTANNNAIFGDFFRLDRNLSVIGDSAGVSFDPSKKIPFTIFSDNGSILESGYAKLDNIIRNKGKVEYKVTLFGGLGSFLYALSYDEDGNKRTLADLDYLTGGDAELDFTINATSVKKAWRNINEGLSPGDSGYDVKWHTINFAPCYNGIPNGDFDAKKAVVVPTSIGLPNSSGSYGLRSGASLVTMTEAHDEWDMKDLRSYLQRPVLSVAAMINAICQAHNNGGYEVDKSAIDSLSSFPFGNLWMTLPMLPSLGTFKQTSAGLSGSFSPVTASVLNNIGQYAITGGDAFGNKLTSTFSARFRTSVVSTASSLVMDYGGRISNIVLQAVAYNSSDEVVGGSDILVLGGHVSTDVKKTCDSFGYSPLWHDSETKYVHVTGAGSLTRVGNNLYEIPVDLNFSVRSYATSRIVIVASSYLRQYVVEPGRAYYMLLNGGRPAPYSLWRNIMDSPTFTPSSATSTGSAITITGGNSSSLRSGAVISKRLLLSSSKTPAEYLLSFCKMFGLYMVYDAPTKKITILRRNDLFLDETIDLTKRIDRSKDITITPMVFDAKWYDFNLEGDAAAYYEEYKNTLGREYGVQRVNTGYDFNAESRNLLDGNAFRNACTILRRGRFFNWILQASKVTPSQTILYPSVFSAPGSKYTLYSSSDSKDFDIPVPSQSASFNDYNEDGHPGYDIEFARKLELCDASGKPLSGDNILVFREGVNNYAYFQVTDDTTAMDVLNDGKPCWLMTPGTEDGVDVPIFQRYTYKSGGWTIDQSLDFGMPSELNIPGIAYYEGVTIYDLAWRNYMRDRYDVNTKVMTCRVNLSGLQVGQELLRKFFWYEGTLWTLNRISNHSLTTLDTTECEFVQVQDKNNYLNGQY